MADFRHSPVEEVGGIARRGTTDPETKIPENWYSYREFGSLSCAPGARPLVHRLSTTTVDNLSGVWEF